MLLLLLATTLAAATNGLGYEAGAVGEARADSHQIIEYQLTPTLRIDELASHFKASAAYTPRLLLAGSHNAVGGVLHRGGLALEWDPGRTTRLSGSQRLSYGRTDFSWQAAAAEGRIPELDRLQQSRPLLYGHSESSVGLEQAVSRALRFGVQGTYSVSGGQDAGARLLAPLVRAYRGTVTSAWRVDRRESLAIIARGELARFPDLAQRSRTADVEVHWEHRFSRVLRLSAGAGVGFLRSADRTSKALDSVLPTFGVSFRRTRNPGETGLAYSLGARLAPTVDPTDASVSFRPEVRAEVEAPVAKRLFVHVLGAVARVDNSTLRKTVVGIGSAALDYRATHDLTLALGVRVARRPTLESGIFVGITLVHGGRFW
jgi:hypothetical protein